MFTMEHSKLMAMFDPSLLGVENLIKNLREIDAQRYYMHILYYSQAVLGHILG